MNVRKVKMLLVMLLGSCGLNQFSGAQSGLPANRLSTDLCVNGRSFGAPTVHAAQRAARILNLCDGHALGGVSLSISRAQPLSLASADFDEDGVPDLVSGFAFGKAGLITVHRGNINALWPYGAALRNGPPEAFFPKGRTVNLPEAPDTLATGDFDADGHLDIVAAQYGSDALYFLRGDGHGSFRSAQRFQLPGTVTAMAAGEINRPDGLTDLIIAVNSQTGPKVLVFESPLGALKGKPEIFPIAHTATSLALGRYDNTQMAGVAVAAGNELVVIHGRNRMLSSSEAERAKVPPAQITVQSFPFVVEAVAAGDFTGAGPSIAALGDDGTVHILEHSVTRASLGPLADPNFRPTFQMGKAGSDGKPVIFGGSLSPDSEAGLTALRRAAMDSANSPEWTERGAVALPYGFNQAIPRLVAARVTGARREDILVADSGNGRIHVLSAAGNVRASDFGSDSSGISSAKIRLLDSLDVTSTPAAVMPMRLSPHGLDGLVILQAGQTVPTVMPQDTPPSNVFTVTNTMDLPSTGSATVPSGSLRAALTAAQNAWTANGEAGNYSIVFDIPTTDPGYNPKTGTFLIQPLSAEPSGSYNAWALGPVVPTILLDGYTQPGASPNTLANGDNAKILIQIDGSLATTAGGDGLDLDDDGSTYRGLALTGWTNYASSGSGQTGARGIDAAGVGDFIEGNFIGIDPSGTTIAANEIGIFVGNGPGLGSTAGGNIVGGTTPQARNILSGNTAGGAFLIPTAAQSQVEGNFIGLDATGAAALPNGNSGVGLNGPGVTIGGTIPGSGNVISGNPSNVDINDLTNEYQAVDSTVQGNLIGTDVTGTKDISSGSIGVEIIHGPDDMLIGGTTPAARNVISGNVYGVYLYDYADDNIVQGNYIGADITGAKALGNTSQGVITGTSTTSVFGAVDNFIGGDVTGAGNVISGNGADGVLVAATGNSPSGNVDGNQGQTIQGNFIGTDSTGKLSIPNGANGIYLATGATANVIGGHAPGAGNLIANNPGNGVFIDPGTATTGEGVGNSTIANTIVSNGGAGVRINSGSQDLISQNSIFSNGALGINLDGLGLNLNTNCQSTHTGPNNSQNAPVLTAGSGTAFITATATDSNNNTSEFSNAVPASASGNVLSLLGSFNSTANTTYTIEFFSSPSADPSGYGQGQTYLGSTTVTTDASCNAPVDVPVNTTEADVSVSLAEIGGIYGNGLQVGPDFGNEGYVATVTNNGAATAHNVVFTDALPSSLEISSAYCDVGPCQSPVTSSLGNCTEKGNTISCTLGTMAAGATANVTVPVQTITAGSITNTVSVGATETDPNLANNTASLTETAGYPKALIDHLAPSTVLAGGSSNLLLSIYGYGLLPDTAVAFNGTSLPTAAFIDNQSCPGVSGTPVYCAEIQVFVPASMLAAPGTPTVTVQNPNQLVFGVQPTLTIAASCTYTNESSLPVLPSTEENDGYIEFVDTTTNVQSCPWTVSSSVPWATVMSPASGTGDGGASIAIAPNTDSSPRTGSVTIAGTTFTFQQDPGATCTYALGSTSATIPAAGGSGTIAVTGTCTNVLAQSYVKWITIPKSSEFINGNGTVNYTVAANTGPLQSGAIAIGNVAFNVTQSAPSCYFTLDTTSGNLPVGGGTGSVKVTASAPNCAWTATPSNSSLISITSGASGTGSGTVNYSVPANTEGPQTGTITIGSQAANAVFTLTEASAFSCTFTLSPASVEIPANGGTNSFQVTASYQNCSWAAAPSDSANVGITFNPSGTGSKTVFYSVSENSGAPRTLTITAGCQTFTINQDGAETTNPAPVITTLSPANATAGSGAFTLTVNGSGFVNGSVVNFGGNARATTYVSANQVTAAILASDVKSAGTPAVTVTNPSPGGGISNSVTFNVEAASAPIASLTAALSFPNTTVNGTSSSMVAILSNTGNATLNISKITIGGSNPTDFAIATGTDACGATLAASASCSIYVTFNPAAAQAYAATLTVTDNATPNTQSASLTGTGTTTAAPIAKLTASVLFPSTTVGKTSSALTATLSNTGNATLNISNISIAGTNPTDFAITTGTNACGATLAASASCNIYVTFTPAAAQAYAATLTVTDNATPGTQSSGLTGTGTAPTAPIATLTPASLSFTATTGTTTSAQSATLSNTGNATLNISNISIAGTNPADFAITTGTNACGAALAASASCSIYVTFTPASAASFSASLQVSDNASSSPQSSSLAGTGTAPVATSFTISSSTSAQSVQPGGIATYTITSTAQNGAFNSPVTLASSGLPAGATATFTPASITPGSSSANSTLSIQTATTTAAVTHRRLGWPLGAPALAIVSLLFLPGKRRRRWITTALLLFASLGGIGALGGCGGGFSLVPPTQTYTVTVTGTSGAIQQSTTVQLTVQ